jgi:hypothetical protein
VSFPAGERVIYAKLEGLRVPRRIVDVPATVVRSQMQGERLMYVIRIEGDNKHRVVAATSVRKNFT